MCQETNDDTCSHLRTRRRGRQEARPPSNAAAVRPRSASNHSVAPLAILSITKMFALLSIVRGGRIAGQRSFASAFVMPTSTAFTVGSNHPTHEYTSALFAKRGLASSQSSSSSSSSSSAGHSSKSSSQSSQPAIRSIPFEQDVEQALAASGYKRPTVNWYPGHIAKAERQLSETLKSVDVVVEVRDARAPKATAHPRVAEWAAGRPRVVVLTHVDSVPEPSRAAWKKSYDIFGAGRWDAEVDGQVRNQAVQGVAERNKYSSPISLSSSSSSSGSAGAGAGAGRSKGSATNRKMDRSAVSRVEDVLFVDAKRGGGIHSINRAVLKAGSHVNERRARRGLSSRPLRVGIIGYPNVGKSALINKILGRKRAKTANTPGITRSLQWIRVRTDDAKKNRGKEFELLDSPGIIPANMVDQSDALLLAACNSIGTAAYDNQAVAAYLLEWLKTLHLMGKGDESSPKFRQECLNRYGFDPLVVPDDAAEDRLLTGEDMLFRVADAKCRGSPEDAARKILQDFRTGRLGPVSLQLAPQKSDDEGQVKVEVMRGVAALGGVGEEMAIATEDLERIRAQERDDRAKAAIETAKERGLELPPMVEKKAESGSDVSALEAASNSGGVDYDGVEGAAETPIDPSMEDEVGKGLFDGW